MALTTCVVSGNLKDVAGNAISGITVRGYCSTPFIAADGTLVAALDVSTTTDSSGDWSLTLVETETIERSLTIEIDLPTGTLERVKRQYTVIVPNSPTANFGTLASGQ